MALVRKLKQLAIIPQNFSDATKQREIHIQNYLKAWNPKLKQDKHGNLFIINPGTPLVCAHMDTVQTVSELPKVKKGNISIYYAMVDKSEKWKGEQELDKVMDADFQIGFDDKCGVAIAMELYETHGDNISILFTTGEETGCNGSRSFAQDNKELLQSLLYCIIADRRHGHDLIGTSNDYCTKEFETDVLKYLDIFGYKSTNGSISDANSLRDYLNCINLSCGYYNPHSSADFLSIDEFVNCFEAMNELVTHYRERKEPYKYVYKYSGGNYNYDKHSKKEDGLFGGNEDEDFDFMRGQATKSESDFIKESVKMSKEMISINHAERDLIAKTDLVLRNEKGESIILKKGSWTYNECIPGT